MWVFSWLNPPGARGPSSWFLSMVSLLPVWNDSRNQMSFAWGLLQWKMLRESSFGSDYGQVEGQREHEFPLHKTLGYRKKLWSFEEIFTTSAAICLMRESVGRVMPHTSSLYMLRNGHVVIISCDAGEGLHWHSTTTTAPAAASRSLS